MYEKKWSFKETNLLIKSDNLKAMDAAINAAKIARQEIEGYVVKNPDFRWSLEPIKLEGKNHRVIEMMADAGKIAGVGPFAAVAGAIAQLAAEAAIDAGAKNVLIENGGDIAIIGDSDFRVGIFAGGAKTSEKLGMLVRVKDLPIGVCTSSGTVGHSISFGAADAAVAVADDAAIADAAATAIANAVVGEDEKKSIGLGIARAKGIEKIRGCLIIRGKHLGAWGGIPEIVDANFEYDRGWK